MQTTEEMLKALPKLRDAKTMSYMMSAYAVQGAGQLVNQTLKEIVALGGSAHSTSEDFLKAIEFHCAAGDQPNATRMYREMQNRFSSSADEKDKSKSSHKRASSSCKMIELGYLCQ